MKCSKCGGNYSDKVYKIHETICKTEVKTSLKIYTLEELQEIAIDKKVAAPSTIKRWKEPRLKKELDICE
jgi:hypothetical protein